MNCVAEYVHYVDQDLRRVQENLSQSLPEEEQMMFASWLNVSPIIEVNGEHFSLEISKPPMYLG